MDTTDDTTYETPSNFRSPIMIQQGKLLKVKVPLTGTVNKHIRGGIGEFSAKSRKRMLETMATVDESRISALVFVTLTYPDGDEPPAAAQSSDDFKNFLKRIHRRFPEASAIWRREWEERKSGENIGRIYPHFHFLFFNLPFVHHTEINRHWGEVLGHDGYLRTEIKLIANWRQAFAYIAKYMAKAPRPPEADEGAAPSGERRRRPSDAEEASGCSLVYIPYQAAQEEQQTDTPAFIPTGRHWGVFNSKCLPMAEHRATRISFEEAERIRGESAQIYRKIDLNSSVGFTLFSEESAGLFDWLLAVRAEMSP